jgi:pectin methylesterase-like acyl-CoA thioesterase
VVTVRKPHVRLHGLGSAPANTEIVFNHGARTSGGTFNTATVFVEADNVTMDNLTINNDLGNHGQAVALATLGDRDIFRNVRILGAQDTLFAASKYCYGDDGPCVPARQYFEDCYVAGNADFIFGDSAAVFERCELHGIAGSHVMYTAQSKHNTVQYSGYVFDHCRLTADPAAHDITLGRPWRPHATVVYLDTQMDAPVIPAGWTEAPRFGVSSLPIAYYAEYRSTGPGADPAAREPSSHQLTAKQAAQWLPARFLAGKDGWRPERPLRPRPATGTLSGRP